MRRTSRRGRSPSAVVIYLPNPVSSGTIAALVAGAALVGIGAYYVFSKPAAVAGAPVTPTKPANLLASSGAHLLPSTWSVVPASSVPADSQAVLANQAALAALPGQAATAPAGISVPAGSVWVADTTTGNYGAIVTGGQIVTYYALSQTP